ncbi:transporter substrate-binding domain-containing protein [Prevotella sp. RM4]|uniref:ATP-binding protein n=1 Tax=Prevotella sp. RM4 TaxID=1200547 RepID=UPI00051B4357|nr:transporter substrate-binding domain-containing protein [Prevotella sp. RM4]
MQTKGFIIKRVWVIAISLAIVLVSCKNGVSEFIPAFDDEPIVSPLAIELGFSKDRPLVMGMNTSYAPLQYVNSQGLPTGYDVEFTKKLLMRMGIPYTFSPNHWDKMSPGIIGGKYDMGMLVYSSYRKDTTNYSDAVFRMYYQVVYRKKDFAEFDFRHLKGKRIAYMKSRPIGLMLKDEEADGYPITDLNEAIVDLANGKYDGVICYRFQAKYHVGLLHLSDQLKADDLSLEPREYCYASHDKRLIDAINAELKKMEAEGIVDEIYGQEVAERFGDIKIPMWVWWLLTGLVFLFMVVYVVNKNRYNRRLQSANAQLQKNNKALQLATARAEESTRMKSIFIEQISHEIRTPLNIICGFTQVLTTTDAELDKAEKRDMSVQIIDNAERITGLVNKMLALAEINSSVVLEREDHTSAAVIAQEAIKAAGINKASHVQFKLVKLFGAEQMFDTHLRSAVLALQQLLDNAKKFTEQGQVTLKISNHEGQACFVVEDTGTSIPVYQAERIFDEFVQLDEYSDGTGIGLSIARSLARRLGGDIVLDTTYTGGARFVMTLQSQQEETA